MGADYKNKRCADCTHWDLAEALLDKTLPKNTAACRERLHSKMIIQGDQSGIQGYYPILQGSFPACSHFSPRVDLT